MTGQQHHRQWSDTYMMYEYKVKQCLRTDHHNWKHCPWKHPGETAAQRRHPSVHKPTFCMNLKMTGECAAGDTCPFSHNTFEMSLHPLRYKTTLCNLGEKCNREICFFAHSHKELRQPEPDTSPSATAVTAGAAATAPATNVQVSGSSFTGASPAVALHMVANLGDHVVQLSSGSFSSLHGVRLSGGSFTTGGSFTSRPGIPGPGAEALLSPVAGGPGVMLAQQQQLQLDQPGQALDQQQLMMLQAQLNSQQQALQLQINAQQALLNSSDDGAGLLVERSAGSAGFMSRVLTSGGLQQQQQAAVQRQDLSTFDSFTSQGSFCGLAASDLQQRLLLQQQQQQQHQQLQLRQQLGQFDSFTSQGSFTAGTSNAASMGTALQQQQAAVQQLRQDLAQLDSFTSQGSFSIGSGNRSLAPALSQPQQAAVLLQDLSNFDSFTSHVSRGVPSLQQQAMLLRQELTGFNSNTSQSSFSAAGVTAHGVALLQQQVQPQQQQPGGQPPVLDVAFDSFTSQCSTSSQISGPAFRPTAISPLLDRSQMLQSASYNRPRSPLAAAHGTIARPKSALGQSLPKIISAPSPLRGGGSLGESNGGAGVAALVQEQDACVANKLSSVDTVVPSSACSAPLSCSLQQQLQLDMPLQDLTAAMQQQVMQLQLDSTKL